MSSAVISRFAAEMESYRYRPTAFCRDILGFEPHDGQRNWLCNSVAPQNALVTGNRWGKSHIAAAKRIYKCVFRKGWDEATALRMDAAHLPYRSWNIAMTADQSRIVWFKANAMLQNPKAAWMVRDIKLTPFPRFEFINGAVFEARSTGNNGERLLGNDLDDVNWDEAAYEKRFEYIRDNVLEMRLVDRGGTLDYTSTGNGRNAFGEYFLSGLPGEKKDPHLYSQAGNTYENYKNFNAAGQIALDRQLARMPERKRRQNIGGEIVDAGGGFFDIIDLEAALSDELTVQLLEHGERDEEGNVRHAEVYAGRDIEKGENGVPWHSRYPSHRYIHFWDIADKKDFVVGWTLDSSGDRMKVVEFERFHKEGWAYNYSRMRERHYKYSIGDPGSEMNRSSKTYFDSTGVGDTVEETLADIHAVGFKFTKSSKDDVLTALQEAFSLRQIEWPMIAVAYDEHKFYERDDKDLVQDTVMALAGAVYFARRREFAYEGD